MEIYYQYEVNEQGVIVALHSSYTPFAERQLTAEQVKHIRVGKTKESEIE